MSDPETGEPHPSKETGDVIAGHDPFAGPTFSLRNRIKRAVWGVVWSLFFQTSPRPAHAWRSWLLRLFGAKLGKGVHVYAKVVIWAPWNLEMEHMASIADGSNVYNIAPVKIGERTVVSQGVYLCTGTHDYDDPLFRLYAEPIKVGAYAWLCAQTFVGPGVTIGDRTVVGACSVVVRDLPAGMICAGNPCKPLKPRKPIASQ
jgi:putative colanic acid biosynthesis acetyltransferase WcaF